MKPKVIPSEKVLVENYLKIYKERTEDQMMVFSEFGYMQKRVDVVEFNPETGYVHGIEFKIRNWNSGYKQCLGNRVLIPYNSLALHYQFIKNVDISQFESKGIGLIALSKNKNHVLLKPKKSKYLNTQKFRVILKKIEKVVYINNE